MTMKLLVVVVVLELKVVKMLVDRTRQGVHLSRKPQRAGLIAEEAPTMVSVEYADFANVFFSDLTSELPIYSLGPQCKHTVCVRGIYLAVDNQVGGTLKRRPKGRFVARSWKSRMSPSRSPPSIWITPIFWHQRLSY